MALTCCTLVDRFVVRVDSEAERRLCEADMALWELETMRRVPGRDPALPESLLDTVERHLMPLAIELGDLGRGGKAVEVRLTRSPLFYSQLVPIDVTDPDMPVFSSDRLSDGALFLLAEALCMEIQVLMRAWSTLAARIFVVDRDTIIGTQTPGAEIIGASARHSRLAERTRSLANSILSVGFRAQDDAARTPFTSILRALMDLSEGVSLGVETLVACQRDCALSTTMLKDERRLSISGGQEATRAFYHHAAALGRLHGWPIASARNEGLDMRAESWREDLHETHLLYAFCFYAVASSVADMDYLRPLVTRSQRFREQGISAAVEALGPRVAVTNGSIVSDDRGVPHKYSLMVHGGGPRPRDIAASVAKYRVSGGRESDDGAYTRLGFCLRRIEHF
jgi:hypothetical protein